ncbi:MAG: type I 3-dehydroquinate dehydratase [Clostridium sp.]|nr:type I 3-dehydroquinate dehydratase [Clostridium sp.]
MKTVKVKNVVLGEGKPKICIPLVDATRKGLADSARRVLAYPCDLIEWRADYYNTKYDPEETAAAIQTLRSILGDFPILYTMRTGREGGMSELTDEEYERTIVTTIESARPDLIDIELSRGDDFMKDMVARAHDRGIAVVASCHAFRNTPPKEELVETMRRMQVLGADIAKYAVMPNSPRDVIELLDATLTMQEKYDDTPLITMSMGKPGIVSRLCGEVFGSCLTFGTAGASSAPGQIPADQLKHILDILHT